MNLKMISTLKRSFHKHPLVTNIVTVVSLIGGADISCQIYEHRGIDKFNWQRLKNMATVGACYYGPVYFYYYRWLDKKFPGTGPRTIATKMFIDQVLFTVPSLCIFFSFMGKLEHKTNEECAKEIKKKFLPTYLTACLFWTPAQVINFLIVPPIYRILYVSTMSFLWLTILSAIKNRPKLPYLVQKIEDLTKEKNK